MRTIIEVRGLRVLAVCGVLDPERATRQPLRIDLDVELDAEAASASDDLGDTVSYAVLCEVASDALVAAAPRLLEHATRVIASAVLDEDHRIEAVAVTVTKLRPPIPLDVATVGVRQRHTR